MEKRLICGVCRDPDVFLAKSSSPLYQGSLICSDDLTLTFSKKSTVMLDQCWGVGFSILEISKLLMQQYYYETLQPTLGIGNVATIMSDTDSFVFVTNRGPEDEVMRLLKDQMDFSNYPPDHKLYSDKVKKRPGYMKNEVPGGKIQEVVALQSKTNSMRVICEGGRKEETRNTTKGVKGAMRKKIPLSEYRRCVEEMTQHKVEQTSLRSFNHINKLIKSEKVAFSSFDDKRFLTCSRHSVPYGSSYGRPRKTQLQAEEEEYMDMVLEDLGITPSEKDFEELEEEMIQNCWFCENPDLLY